jgi:uncharacterized coiled-coil protein SlyX
MSSPEIQLFTILIMGALALFALGLAAIAFVRLTAMHRRVGELEAQAEQNAEHYRGLSAGVVGQGEQLARLEQELVRLRSRLDEVAANSEGTGAAFDQAVRMARKGCSAREIMETCGLSEIEADLVVLMHKSGRTG